MKFDWQIMLSEVTPLTHLSLRSTTLTGHLFGVLYGGKSSAI